MHRKPEADLLPLDTKIERTLRNLRKITSVESKSMKIKEKDYNLFQKKQKQKDLKANDYGRLLEAFYSR